MGSDKCLCSIKPPCPLCGFVWVDILCLNAVLFGRSLCLLHVNPEQHTSSMDQMGISALHTPCWTPLAHPPHRGQMSLARRWYRHAEQRTAHSCALLLTSLHHASLSGLQPFGLCLRLQFAPEPSYSLEVSLLGH